MFNKKIITIIFVSTFITNSFAQIGHINTTPYSKEYLASNSAFTYDNQILENYETSVTFLKLREGQHTIGQSYGSRYNGTVGNKFPREWEQLKLGQSVRIKLLVPPGVKKFGMYFEYASKSVVEGICTSDGRCVDNPASLSVNFPSDKMQEDYVYVTLKTTNIDLLLMGAGISLEVGNPQLYEDWRSKKFNNTNNTSTTNTTNNPSSETNTGGLTFVTADKWKPIDYTASTNFKNENEMKQNDRLQYMGSLVNQPEKVREFAVNNSLTNKDVAIALGIQESQVPTYFGQVGLKPLKPSNQAIKSFVEQNMNNPKVIYDAANTYDLNTSDLSTATGYSQAQINNYFNRAGLKPLKPSNKAIKAFIEQNVKEPKVIFEAAKYYNLSVDDLAKAINLPREKIIEYFNNQNLKL